MITTKEIYIGFGKLWKKAEEKLGKDHFRWWLCGIYGTLSIHGNEKILEAARRAFDHQFVHQEKIKKED